MVSNKSVLVLGHSHTVCIANHINLNKGQSSIKVINLNSSPHLFNKDKARLESKAYENLKLSAVYFSIDGNFHNIFGLVENPIPFSIGDPKLGRAHSEDNARFFIPRNMVKHYFKKRLAETFKTISGLSKQFSDLPQYCFCAPPPIPGKEHLQKYPGVFKKRIDCGVAPNYLRMECYAIQTELYEELCDRLNISFIAPPKESLDADGFLEKTYWKNDPTHGNKHYGKLLVSQIEDTLESGV